VKLEYFLLVYEISTQIDLDPDAERPAFDISETVRIPYNEIAGFKSSSTDVFIMWRNTDRSYRNSLKFRI